MNRYLLRCTQALVVALCWVAASASAAPIFWTDWQGTDTCAGACFTGNGVITTTSSTVNVSYTNAQGIAFYQTGLGGETNYWSPGAPLSQSPYTSTAVDNPPPTTDIIALQFQGVQTLTFSVPIANPVFAFVSLNGNGYRFLNQDFEILSLGGVDGNVCGFWGCGGAERVVNPIGGGNVEYQLNSNNVGGSEPHGVIRFLGTFSTLSWTSASNENWNGFTVGVQGTAQEVFPGEPGVVPEPTTMLLLGSGLAGLYVRRRRKP